MHSPLIGQYKLNLIVFLFYLLSFYKSNVISRPFHNVRSISKRRAGPSSSCATLDFHVSPLSALCQNSRFHLVVASFDSFMFCFLQVPERVGFTSLRSPDTQTSNTHTLTHTHTHTHTHASLTMIALSCSIPQSQKQIVTRFRQLPRLNLPYPGSSQ